MGLDQQLHFLACLSHYSLPQHLILTAGVGAHVIPQGFDQVIPQVLAVFLFYLSLVSPVGTTREGLLFGR
jgi:hypothetical protein